MLRNINFVHWNSPFHKNAKIVLLYSFWCQNQVFFLSAEMIAFGCCYVTTWMQLPGRMKSEKRKKNMKVYSIHRMLTFDLLFYYAIKFLFLTQIKGFKSEDVVIASACWGLFRVLFQVPITTYIDKFGNKKSLITANILQAIGTIVLMSSENMYTLILANLFGGIAYAMKEVAETGILNLSIPETENKSQIYSKIDGKSTFWEENRYDR